MSFSRSLLSNSSLLSFEIQYIALAIPGIPCMRACLYFILGHLSPAFFVMCFASVASVVLFASCCSSGFSVLSVRRVSSLMGFQFLFPAWAFTVSMSEGFGFRSILYESCGSSLFS